MSNTDEEFITRRIYAIKCDLDNIIYYVGSTKNTLKRRFNSHKRNFKGWPGVGCNVSVFIKFNEFGINNFSIVLLKEYHNIDKKGIFAMETLWIYKMKRTNNCKIVNESSPFGISTKQHNRIYNYYNKEDKALKHKQYREQNKEKYKCDVCDFYTYCQSDLNKHNESIKHKINSGEMTEDNMYKCNHCKFYNNEKDDFIKHLISEEHLKNIKNKIDSGELKKENIVNYFKYKCNYCCFQNNDRDNFIKHLKCKEHIDTIEIIKKSGQDIVIDFQYNYSCEVCEFYCDGKKDYDIHLISKSHIEKSGKEYTPEFICKACNYGNNLKKNYDKHCKTKNHLEKTKIFNISNGISQIALKYKYNCEECDFHSDDKTEYNKHNLRKPHLLAIGLKWNPEFICKPCKFETNIVGDYNRHLKTKTHIQLCE